MDDIISAFNCEERLLLIKRSDLKTIIRIVNQGIRANCSYTNLHLYHVPTIYYALKKLINLTLYTNEIDTSRRFELN